MAKNKYQFQPETLTFKKVEFNFIEHFLKKFLTQSAVSLVIGAVLFTVAYKLIDSPKEQELQREKKALQLKYDLLGKHLGGISERLTNLQNRDDNIYRPVFEADPIPQSIRQAGFGGINRYENLESYANSESFIAAHQQLDKITKQLYVQSKSYDELVKLIKAKEKMLACIPAIQPISMKDLTRFGSAFGMRLHPILGYYRMHNGVDLTAPTGTKIYAAGDGKVTRAEHSANGLGKNVIIDHGYSYKTVYAHLSKILVEDGQNVKRGDVIGLVGMTGLATCPHLHYEVRKNDSPVNPVNYYYNDLTDEEYEKMIEMSAKANTHVFEKY